MAKAVKLPKPKRLFHCDVRVDEFGKRPDDADIAIMMQTLKRSARSRKYKMLPRTERFVTAKVQGDTQHYFMICVGPDHAVDLALPQGIKITKEERRTVGARVSKRSERKAAA